MANKKPAPKRNLAQIAFAVAEMAIGEAPMALSESPSVKRSPVKGGKAQAQPLTKAQRAEIAKIDAIVSRKKSKS